MHACNDVSAQVMQSLSDRSIAWLDDQKVPYLYCHQGDCEHLFAINEIRYATCNGNGEIANNTN
jgi:hypothetical protein